jgi:hypothetical protein
MLRSWEATLPAKIKSHPPAPGRTEKRSKFVLDVTLRRKLSSVAQI